jgi:hypothetical protein
MANLEEALRRALETLREDARQHVNSGVRKTQNFGVAGVTGVTIHKNNEVAVTPFKNPRVTDVTGQGQWLHRLHLVESWV